MRKLVVPFVLAGTLAAFLVSCEKSATPSAEATNLTQEEKALVASAGFNNNWAERRPDGNYLVEGDILLTRTQLEELAGTGSPNELIIANEEHYRTTNIVSTPGSGVRTITVSIASGFPSYYTTGLDDALARYNSYGLKINFVRVIV